MTLETTLISLAIIAVSAVLMAIISLIQRRNIVNIHSSLENIKNIGELCALRVIVKEIVTVECPGSWLTLTSDGRMAVVCHFDVEFRFDLRHVKIERDANRNYFRVEIPPHFVKVSTDRIQYYDERHKRFMLIFPIPISADEHNTLLENARNEAANIANRLHDNEKERIRTSVAATIRGMAAGFGAERVEFQFLEAESILDQIRDGMKELAAA